jgi:hypothetical protein
VLGATNFPPSVAKYLYRRFTDDIKDHDQINIYDSSAGFGGRLLGALSAGTDRQLHYVGTDPNPDNWLEEAGMSPLAGCESIRPRGSSRDQKLLHDQRQLPEVRANFRLQETALTLRSARTLLSSQRVPGASDYIRVFPTGL